MLELLLSIAVIIISRVFNISPLTSACVSFFAAANLAFWVYLMPKEDPKRNMIMLTLLIVFAYGAFCLGVVFTVDDYEKKAEHIGNDSIVIEKTVAESNEIARLNVEISADKETIADLRVENESLSLELREAEAKYFAYKTSSDKNISDLKETIAILEEEVSLWKRKFSETDKNLQQLRKMYDTLSADYHELKIRHNNMKNNVMRIK